jgi:plastocyanin
MPAAIVLTSGLSLAAMTEIDQVGQHFSQTRLILARGDTVRFANHADVTHNVGIVDERDKAIDVGLQKPGETIRHVFGSSGKFVVRCSIHAKMKMTVTVH